MKKISRTLLLVFLLIPLVVWSAGCAKKEKRTWIERWGPERPMTHKRAGLAAVAVGKRIYAIGGGEFSAEGLRIFNTVEYAEAAEDGTVGEWKPAASLTTPRVYLTAVVQGDYIYVMGGESKETLYTGAEGEKAPELLYTVERAKINPDGTIGEWVLEKEKMHFPRRGGEFFVHGGMLYAAGGFGGDFLNDVEKARINPDGTIGKWEEDSFFARDRYISGYAQKGGNLYVMGGHVNSPERAMDSVETAAVSPEGAIGEWKETSPLYTKRFLNTALVKGDAIYTFAGHNTVNLASTERAAINPDGTLGKWEPDTPLNVPRRAPAAVTIGDTLYVLGGMIKPMGASESVDVVESAKIVPGKKLGVWVEPASEAVKLYDEWKSAIPMDAEAHILHGRVFLPTGQYDTVLFDVSEALKAYPRYVDAYLLQAETHQMMGKIDDAMGSLEKVLEIESNNFVALMGLGLLHFEREDYKGALENYAKAAKANPDSVDARFNLGNTYLRMEDYASAKTEFEWVMAKAPELDEAKHLLDVTVKAQAEKKAR